MKRVALFLVLTVVILEGCSAFTAPSKNPVIEKQIGFTGVLAVKADRRIAYVDIMSGRFCAEPSPDVSEAFTNMMSAAVEAGAEKGGFSGNATIDFQHAFATSVSPLLVRSQGVQLFRDGAFALCQMQRNKEKAFFEKWKDRGDDPDAKKEAARRDEAEQMHFSNLLSNATELIRLELADITEARRQLAQANVAPGISMTGGNSTMTINGPVGLAAQAAAKAPVQPDPKTQDKAGQQPDPKASGKVAQQAKTKTQAAKEATP